MSKSKDIQRHPSAIAWDKWITSAEGVEASDLSSLVASIPRSEKYQRNRLFRAFVAGWNSHIDAENQVVLAKLEEAELSPPAGPVIDDHLESPDEKTPSPLEEDALISEITAGGIVQWIIAHSDLTEDLHTKVMLAQILSLFTQCAAQIQENKAKVTELRAENLHLQNENFEAIIDKAIQKGMERRKKLEV